jgi:FtsH-binding integral membrane protein
MEDIDSTIGTGMALPDGTMTRVFGKMSIAMVVSALTAWLMTALGIILPTGVTLIGLLLIVALNLILVPRTQTLAPMAMYAMFAFEAVYMGALIGGYVQYYDPMTTMVAFIVSAIYFGTLVVVGLTTHKDLTKIGSICMIALIVLIIVEIILMFINAPVLWMLASAVSLVIFAGLTAHDAQQMKDVDYDGSTSTENLTTLLALNLYLDFVNIFVNLLQILNGGKR